MKTSLRLRSRRLAGWWLALLATVVSATALTNDETAHALGLSKFVLPDYPGMLRMEGVPDGETLVAISRDGEGKPRDVLALETTRPEFASAAVEAVQAWRFAPAGATSVAGGERPRLVRFIFKSGGVTMVPPQVRPTRGKSVAESTDYQPVTFAELDRMPKALRQPLPAFPRALSGKTKTGEASVTFFVDETGRVRVPVVTAASAPEFAQAALQTMEQWTYEPPRRAGRPVVACESLKIQFGPTPQS